MKTFPLSQLARSLTLGLAVTVGISAQGASSNETAHVGKKKAALAVAGTLAPSASANAIGMLDRAYGLLRSADHDYKGHRARAMHQIEDAARELGAKLSGNGRAGEKQGESDSQVRNAQSLLAQAIGKMAGKPHHHVAVALNQLNIALKVK